jgi:formylglycine-generating enzyme required for sulfatase activity
MIVRCPGRCGTLYVSTPGFDLNSGDSTQPVGRKRPNPWGLHGMLGNVWEWWADVWHDDYVGTPGDGNPWVAGAERQPRRCLRGSAWDMNAFRCRSPLSQLR